MSVSQLIVLTFAFGIATGVLFAALFVGADRRSRRAIEAQEGGIPDVVAAMLGALNSPAVLVDGSNQVLVATESAERLALVDGRTLAHAELEELSDAVRRDQRPLSHDYVLRRGSVGAVTLHLTAEGAPLGVGQVLLRVEDRSEAVRLDTVRRDFVANVGHELKTPIGAVSLLAEALISAADDPETVRRFGARLLAESARLGAITGEIIDFTRLQSADPLAEPAQISLDDVVHAAVDRNAVAAEAEGVQLVAARRSGIAVMGDGAMLTTAVHNLIANAVQYSPAGSRIGIGVRERDGAAEISVTDQGTGIPPEDVDRIFERFYRADPARSRHTGGTGLGLSIVKHIAESHGGDVTVWSRVGRGSTFTVRLPIVVTAEPSPAKRQREKERA